MSGFDVRPGDLDDAAAGVRSSTDAPLARLSTEMWAAATGSGDLDAALARFGVHSRRAAEALADRSRGLSQALRAANETYTTAETSLADGMRRR